MILQRWGQIRATKGLRLLWQTPTSPYRALLRSLLCLCRAGGPYITTRLPLHTRARCLAIIRGRSTRKLASCLSEGFFSITREHFHGTSPTTCASSVYLGRRPYRQCSYSWCSGCHMFQTSGICCRLPLLGHVACLRPCYCQRL